MEKFNLLATCASGIEGIVGDELRDMGYEVRVENGRARFEGTAYDIARTNVGLRTADRIKIIVSEFEVTSFEALYDLMYDLPFEDYLPLNAEFPVRGRSQQSQLYSVSDIQSISKKALVDKISDTYHKVGRLPESGPKFPIEVAIHKDQALVTMDTTGPSLFKRGYRSVAGHAPIKENMAAALIKLTNWQPDMPFHDPVCGSGTIPIEAALIGLNLAPGLNRDFIFESWPWFDSDIIEEVKDEAWDLANFDQALDITGTDIDHRMIDMAIENARGAGLSQNINFKQMQLADFTTDKKGGVIVANPPYGERLNDEEEVLELYRQMGEIFRPLESWSKYILTSHLGFEKFYGEKATKRRKLYNGRLRTDYFQYWAKSK